jgi:hypothetical protein
MTIELTTESSLSHYGIPVLCIDGVDYGPSDIVPTQSGVVMTGAEVVVELVLDGTLSRAEGESFCAQWPDGPQP